MSAGGTVYVADTRNAVIRRITPEGVVSTLAGRSGATGHVDGAGSAARFNFPRGLALEPGGTLLVADTFNNAIRRVDAQGNVTTVAVTVAPGAGLPTPPLLNPTDIALDGAGNIHVATPLNHTVMRIAAGGALSVLAGSTGNPGLADGSGAAARFNLPTCLAPDGAGNLLVADTRNQLVRRVTPAGAVTRHAGTPAASGAGDGSAGAARFNGPAGLALDGAGNLYVADAYNQTVRRIAPGGAVTTLAGLAGATGSADGPGGSARFRQPGGLAVDAAGTLYASDIGSNTLRRISSSGTVSTLAGTADRWGSTDGSGAAAAFSVPAGLALERDGNLVVADMYNHTLRRVTPAGAVSTLAGSTGNSGSGDGVASGARFNFPAAVAVDGSGNLYVADSGNHTIRRVTPAGAVSTVAGTPEIAGNRDGVGTDARFHSPIALHITAAGRLYVLDAGNGTLRRLTPAGQVTTVARLPAVAANLLRTLPGTLLSPAGLSSAPDGTLYASVLDAVVSVSPD